VRTPDRHEGLINTTYLLSEAEAEQFAYIIDAGDNGNVILAPTRIVVTTFCDGDVSVDFYGRPVTKNGKINQGSTVRPIYVAPHRKAGKCQILGIDATAIPAVRAITQPYEPNEE
jgi:hypothetical protein